MTRVFLMLVFTLLVPSYAVGAVDSDEPTGYRTIAGVVTEIASGSVSIKTEEGTVRNFGTTQFNPERLHELKKGDHITLHVDEDNQLVDVSTFVAPPRDDQDLISGRIVNLDLIKKTVTLTTDAGQHVSYGLQDSATVKIISKDIGDRVTLRIDQAQRLATEVIN